MRVLQILPEHPRGVQQGRETGPEPAASVDNNTDPGEDAGEYLVQSPASTSKESLFNERKSISTK